MCTKKVFDFANEWLHFRDLGTRECSRYVHLLQMDNRAHCGIAFIAFLRILSRTKRNGGCRSSLKVGRARA
jgi:hypothetical protein